MGIGEPGTAAPAHRRLPQRPLVGVADQPLGQECDHPLHVGSQVLCAHAGQAQPTVPNPRVLVSGQPVVPMSGPWVVAGCVLPPPIAANGPCVTGMWLTGTLRVTSMAQPLVVFGGQSLCAPTGTPLLPLASQTRVVAQ